jgi:hypothetical protein
MVELEGGSWFLHTPLVPKTASNYIHVKAVMVTESTNRIDSFMASWVSHPSDAYYLYVHLIIKQPPLIFSLLLTSETIAIHNSYTCGCAILHQPYTLENLFHFLQHPYCLGISILNLQVLTVFKALKKLRLTRSFPHTIELLKNYCRIGLWNGVLPSKTSRSKSKSCTKSLKMAASLLKRRMRYFSAS